MYCDVMNMHLERHGHAARLHPDSLEARGFTRQGEGRLKPSDSNALKFRGEVTERMAEVLKQRESRRPQDAAERRQAQQYWVERSRALGITPGMPKEDALKRIITARDDHAGQRPPRMTLEEAKAHLTELEREDQTLTRLVQRLNSEQRVEESYTAQGKERPQDGKHRMAKVLAEASNPKKPLRVLRATATSRLTRGTRRLKQQIETQAALRVHLATEEERRRQRERAQDMGY
jgi:hypothetical protein